MLVFRSNWGHISALKHTQLVPSQYELQFELELNRIATPHMKLNCKYEWKKKLITKFISFIKYDEIYMTNFSRWHLKFLSYFTCLHSNSLWNLNQFATFRFEVEQDQTSITHIYIFFTSLDLILAEMLESYTIRIYKYASNQKKKKRQSRGKLKYCNIVF